MSSESPELDWESASVHDGTLTVEIAGDRPEHWGEVFQQTAKLLAGGEWEAVECKDGTVTITGVRADGEEKLAHFLKSVVQQVNANFASASDEGDEGAETESSPKNRKEDKEDPDAELTARFRAFRQ